MKRGGIALIIIGTLLIVAGAFAGAKSVEGTIDDRYERTGGPAGATTWSCGDDDPIKVGRELRERLRPQAYQEHEGAAYLRTSRRIVIVERGADGCRITAETHDRRYSHGGFIFLGPGFGPSSPAGGSGGNSGSWGGAK